MIRTSHGRHYLQIALLSTTAYFVLGNGAQAQSPPGPISFEYDALGNLTVERDGLQNASRLPQAGMAAAETVAARNALKSYFRGRPLNEWMPRWSSRMGYPTLEDLLVKNGGNLAEVVARSGGTSTGWTVGLIGAGSVKTGFGAIRFWENECDCSTQ